MKKLFLLVVYLILSAAVSQADENSRPSKINLLKEMFQKMVVNKNASLIPYYYSKDFILYSNGKKENYSIFYDSHKKYYQTPIQYAVQFDDTVTVESGDKIATRVFITTKMPDTTPQKIEVILIVQYKDNKIIRTWEVTDPDWSKMKEFKK